jgi:hypothetical protein
MNHRIAQSTGGSYYNVYEFPELANEIPTILSAAGKVQVRRDSDVQVHVTIDLHNAIQIVRPAGACLWVNKHTGKVQNNSLTIIMNPCPQGGDKKVTLLILLEIRTFEPEIPSTEIARGCLCSLVRRLHRISY